MKNIIFKYIFLSLFFTFSLNNFYIVNAVTATNCKNIKLETATPQQLIECGSADENTPKSTGTSLYDIIMLINNTLAIIAVFFSIIGVIVGVIGLMRAQANKTQLDEAKGIITNSILAFIITASIWIIVKLVFNTLGIGALIS